MSSASPLSRVLRFGEDGIAVGGSSAVRGQRRAVWGVGGIDVDNHLPTAQGQQRQLRSWPRRVRVELATPDRAVPQHASERSHGKRTHALRHVVQIPEATLVEVGVTQQVADAVPLGLVCPSASLVRRRHVGGVTGWHRMPRTACPSAAQDEAGHPRKKWVYGAERAGIGLDEHRRPIHAAVPLHGPGWEGVHGWEEAEVQGARVQRCPSPRVPLPTSGFVGQVAVVVLAEHERCERRVGGCWAIRVEVQVLGE